MANGVVTPAQAVQWTTNYPFPNSGITIKPFPKSNPVPPASSYLPT